MNHIQLNIIVKLEAMFSQSKDDVKLEWMYKGPNATVDREEYLLGRAVDKTLEQLNEEEKQKQLGLAQQPKNHVEHECIPPSIRDYKKQQLLAEQVDIQNKLQEDPLIAIKKREEECRRQFLNNPVQLKKLQEALVAKKNLKKDKKKKSKKKHASSDSDSDIDSKLVEKLKLLKRFPTKLSLELKLKSKKKVKSEEDSILDTILMHKFNAFKSKLSDEDMQDILAGKITDSESDSISDKEENDAVDTKKRKKNKKKDKKKNKRQHKRYENDSDSEKKDRIKNKSTKKHKSDLSSSSSDSEESNFKKQAKSNHTQRPKEITKGKEEQTTSKVSEHRQNINFNKNHKNTNPNSPLIKNYSSLFKENMSYKDSSRHYYKNSDKNENNRSKRKSESSHGKKGQNKGRESSSDNDQNEKRKRLLSDKDLETKKDNTTRVKSSNKKDTRMYPENPYNSRKYSDSSSKGYPELKSSKQSYQSSDSNSDSDSKNKKRNYGLISGDGKRLKSTTKIKHFNEQKSTSIKSPELRESSDKRSGRPKCKELSREEREKRIKEMMANAAWRDKERAEAVRIHRESESNQSKIPDEYNPEFLHKELLKSANSASVESRIKANVNNIQRSSRDMSSNFSKRN
ncbi:uncharacterized protein DDB_G0283697-like [Agrilus planipennis]|uniref:Uncharacterized protein DDB_G0283697-like n=1 Tax=Agrilus planipennis TaxID=224129 RepID=A0A1W4XKC7_AGRPL|nr:uncharacterized protein DDB_G0283697-like [Agrilus planipennis]